MDARKQEAAIEALESQMAGLRDDVSAILATLAKVANGEIKMASQSAQEGLDGIGRRGRRAAAAAGERVRSAASDVRSTVEDYPISTALVGIGIIGLVVAWLIRGR